VEALLDEPEQEDPREVILVCQPHPKGGGTMHNKVVHRLARGLRKSGAVVLRFNFRGVNLSEGDYAHGIGEVEDARAALAWLRDTYASESCSCSRRTSKAQ
jgi:alpha/beta superfamily hydrolase